MKIVDKFLPKGSFVRNVVTLMSGTTFAQIITILISPLLTRLYGPTNFGIYTYYISILSILSVIACLRYELAVVLPEEETDAINIFVGGFFICLKYTILILILVLLFGKKIADLLKIEGFEKFLLFMPLSVLASGLFQLFNYWCTRQKKFKELATRQITQSSAMAVVQTGTGFFSNSVAGLIFGNIIGQTLATFRMGIRIWKDNKGIIKGSVNIKRIHGLLKDYKKYPLFSTWGALLNIASNMLPSLLFGYFFSAEIVGYYSLAHRLLTIPMTFIGSAISQVYFPKATEAKLNGTLSELTESTFYKLFNIGFVPICLVVICAPQLFSLVFGEEWLISGVYVRYFALWIFLQLLASPLSTVYDVLQKQNVFLIQNVIFFVLRLGVIIFTGYLNNSELCIKLYGITGAILYLVYLLIILKFSKVSLFGILNNCLKLFFKYSLFLIIPLLIQVFSNSLLLTTFISIFFGILYILYSFIKKKNIG